MSLWFILVVPILLGLLAYRTVRPDLPFLVGPFCLTVVLIIAATMLIDRSRTQRTEYFGDMVDSVTYSEPWDEEVPCSHTKYCERPTTSTDKDGKVTTGTESYACGTEHAYDVDYHPPAYTLSQRFGDSLSTDESKWSELSARWGKVEHITKSRDVHSKSLYRGDDFVSTWDGKPSTFEPTVTVHTYSNRVADSGSTFSPPKVSPGEAARRKLSTYPSPSGYLAPSILGDIKFPGYAVAERELTYVNSALGPTSQVKFFIVVFRGGDISDGVAQRNFWRGGNKNEFVTTLGVDESNNLLWVYDFTWSESENFKVGCRDFLSEGIGKPLDLPSYISYLAKETPKGWKRKSFSDFDYISVVPTANEYLLVFSLSLFASSLLVFGPAVFDFFSSRPPSRRYRRRPF